MDLSGGKQFVISRTTGEESLIAGSSLDILPSFRKILLSHQFPRLFSFAKDKLASVRDVIQLDSLTDTFHMPLSAEAFLEYNELQVLLQDISLTDATDEWVCNFKESYSAKAYYTHSFAGIHPDGPSKWIWKSKCMSKHKVFAWLILNDRLNTKDMMIRRLDHCWE